MDTAFMSLDKRSILVRDQNDELRHVFSNWQSKVVSQLRSAGITLEVHQSNAFEIEDIRPVNLMLLVNVGEPVAAECRHDGQRLTEDFNHGDVQILPVDRNFSWRCHVPVTCLVASLDAAVFRKVTPDSDTKNSTDFGAARRVQDSFLCESLKNLARNTGGDGRVLDLHIESVAVSLATHLLNHYTVAPSGNTQRRDRRFSQRLLRSIDEHIEQNLSNEIKVVDLAKIAGLSPFHFSRVFKSTAGDSPYRYVMNCRLKRGMELLRTTDKPVAEIASEVGFCDQSHFTRELSRTRGVTPRQLRIS